MNTDRAMELIVEIRGRLAELEQALLFGGGDASGPIATDRQRYDILTPQGYLRSRTQGELPEGDDEVGVFQRVEDWLQVASADGEDRCKVEKFPLTELHSLHPGEEFGIRLTPLGETVGWFTFEFIVDGDPLATGKVSEWMLKLASPVPFRIQPEFIVDFGDGSHTWIHRDAAWVSEFATFFHFKLWRDELERARGDRSIQSVRLILGTGGNKVPLEVYGFSVKSV